MYIPASFAETDQNKLHDFIEQHSFATLVSQSETGPLASHLPLLLDRGGGPHGRLIGHMARANPQWQQADGQSVLVIFNGPHAYISPTWYQDQNVVPTWNYVAVHATGRLHVDDSRERRLEIVREYVEVFETGQPAPWSIDSQSPEFIDRLLDAIVGFEIPVDRIEGKWKLNQNQNDRRRGFVVEALLRNGRDNSQCIAEMMKAALTRR